MEKFTFSLLAVVLAVQVFGAKAQTDEFLQQSLDSHNLYRQKHGVPKLVLNEAVSKVAREWAKKLAAENRMYHRPNNKYGENIFWISGGPLNGAQPTKWFYNEIKDYDFDNPTFSLTTGHFTQVVWRKSQLLGIGTAKSATGGTYVVANYDPPGNYLGQFKENVPRPIS